MWRLKILGIAINLSLTLLSVSLIVGANLPRIQAAGSSYPINLYFHNDSSSPLIGGFVHNASTLNTTQAWRNGPRGFVNFTSKLNVDYYLHPDLAGSLTINSTVWLHPWLVGSSTGRSQARGIFTVALYDVSPSGQVAVGVSTSSPSERIPYGVTASQSGDVNSVPGNAPLKFTVGSYTFSPGHSILVHVEMLPEGTGTVLSFYLDSQMTPSYVTLYASTIVAVPNTWDENATGFRMTIFPLKASNPLILLYANVTDPLGGYDINASTVGHTYASVALDLITPQSVPVLFQERMSLLQGGQTSFQNLFRLNFSFYARSGLWGVNVNATDNSGNQVIGYGSVVFASQGPPPFTIPAWMLQLGELILALVIGATIIVIVRRQRRRRDGPSASWKPSLPETVALLKN